MALNKDVLSITYQHGGNLHNTPYGRWKFFIYQRVELDEKSDFPKLET
tara:strand:- start:2830 stop:2973 length:144 start_codon:yes stop_codon:yes gene_type:complete